MRQVRAGPLRARFVTTQARKLAVDIDNAGDKSQRYLRRAVDWSADEIVDRWKRNARVTARRHGRLYPKTIGYDLFLDGLRAEIGPDARRKQGGMNFEYGSRNQPPHLDGNRAMDDVEKRFLLRVRNAMELDL